MSRKRGLSTVIMDIEELVTPPYAENCNCEYIRPGWYCPPQLVQFNQSLPYNNTFHVESCYFPSSANVTYVVDMSGRAYYMSDIEHRLEVPAFMMPPPLHQANHFEIPSMPHIDEDDYYDPPESPHKRKRYDEDSDDREDCKCNTEKCTTNVYRSKRGYLVEEPVDPHDAKQIKK